MCEDFLINASLYIDDMLDEDEKALFLEHINCCDNCAKSLDELIFMQKEIQNIEDIEFPDDLHSNIMNAVNESKKSENVKVIDGIFDEKKPSKNKIIDFKFTKVASVVAIMLIATTLLNNFNIIPKLISKKSVLANDLTLSSKQSSSFMHTELCIVMKEDDFKATADNITNNMKIVGSVNDFEDADDYVYIEGVLSEEEAISFLDDILTYYDSATYIINKTDCVNDVNAIEEKIEINEEIKGRLEEIEATRDESINLENVISSIDLLDKENKALIDEKQLILDYISNITVKVIIRK